MDSRPYHLKVSTSVSYLGDFGMQRIPLTYIHVRGIRLVAKVLRAGGGGRLGKTGVGGGGNCGHVNMINRRQKT